MIADIFIQINLSLKLDLSQPPVESVSVLDFDVISDSLYFIFCLLLTQARHSTLFQAIILQNCLNWDGLHSLNILNFEQSTTDFFFKMWLLSTVLW